MLKMPTKDYVNRGRNDHDGDVDLELLVRNTHKLYLQTKAENPGERSHALLGLSLAAELYRKYGPFCTREEFKERADAYNV